MPISSNPRIRATDPFDFDAPDYLNPQSDDEPLDPDIRAQWLEERGYDPKADGDFKRANGNGMTISGEFIGKLPDGELDLIRPLRPCNGLRGGVFPPPFLPCGPGLAISENWFDSVRHTITRMFRHGFHQ